jgi:TCP-1/cpn60 chaperonin family/Caspase domain
MTLEPVKERCGVWRENDYPVKTPGVHALIAGISDYPHLAGGSYPAPNPMGMGQLVVSATGAAQIFDWLRKAKRLARRPVISCRLLLAPGQSLGPDGTTEQAFVDRITGGHYDDPTFDGLARAIKEWADEFFIIPKHRCSENAAFFVFSGHGLEVMASPSLLARDILNPNSAQGPNNAVAYKRVIEALQTFGLGDGLFLFDACRNEPELAKQLNIVGQEILKPAPQSRKPPQCMMWLKATDAGSRAYQDPKGPRRASLFGQAVLEALEGIPPDYRPYDITETPWRLLFQGLESYIKNRVRVLLAAKNTTKLQTVIPGGEPFIADTLVAEREPEKPPGTPPTSSFNPDSLPVTAIPMSSALPRAVTDSADALADLVSARAAQVFDRFDVTYSRVQDNIGIVAENDAERFGIDIVRRALQAPLRQIAENAGEDGAVIANTILDRDEYNWGFDAQTTEFKDLVKAGIVDPTKVVRTALQDAASVAGLLVTTEAMVAEKPEKKSPLMSPGSGGIVGGGDMDY